MSPGRAVFTPPAAPLSTGHLALSRGHRSRRILAAASNSITRIGSQGPSQRVRSTELTEGCHPRPCNLLRPPASLRRSTGSRAQRCSRAGQSTARKRFYGGAPRPMILWSCTSRRRGCCAWAGRRQAPSRATRFHRPERPVRGDAVLIAWSQRGGPAAVPPVALCSPGAAWMVTA